jgi:ABC-type amino acid transport substrate-binding protein
MHFRTVRKPSHIIGCADEQWSYTDKVKDLKADDLAALVSDGSALQYRIAQETECSLHTLQEDLGTFDHAFAFRANFSRDYPNLIPDINVKLLEWNEEGDLKVCAFHCSSLL